MYKKIIFLILLFYTSINAQWIQTNGPYEATICSFAVSDSSIYAGTIGAGIYRSTDNGESWAFSNGDMTSMYTLCFAVSGKYLYAGSAIGHGISLSTDNGTTWVNVNNGLPPNPWSDGDNQVVTGVIDRLAASGNNVFASIRLSPEAFYLSTDNGSNWTNANIGTIPGISSIAVIGNNFFVGSSNGVYISQNNGETWISTGLTDSVITSLAVSYTGSSKVNLFASTSGSIFLSTNNGITWVHADSGLPGNGIVKLSANGSYVIADESNASFFLSTNCGTNWTALNSTSFLPSYAEPNDFTPVGTNLLYGYLDWGIYRSTDNGKNWVVSNTGLKEASINGLAATANSAFVSTNSYIYENFTNNMNWIPAFTGKRIMTALDSVVYMTSDRGICYSSDNGKSWVTPLSSNAPEGFEYTALAVEGTNIYLGGAGSCGLCDQGGVYLSTDKGVSWNKKGLENISILATNGSNIYAVIDNVGLLVSTDTAKTWNTISLLAKNGILPGINSIAFRGFEIFVGCIGISNGVFWGGVLHSTDGGNQWEYLDTGFPDNTQWWVTCLAVQGTNIFAGTTAGVYVLNNDNKTWTAVNTGLPTSDHVYCLTTNATDIYAGLSGTVWKRPISDIVTFLPSAVKLTTFLLYQNFPNPFNPSTTISYSVPKNSFVTIKVYDILGKEITTLVNGEKSAGNYSLQFNGNGLSSGIYFYRMQAGSFVQTKKLLLLK
jgi:hypothetical protein